MDRRKTKRPLFRFFGIAQARRLGRNLIVGVASCVLTFSAFANPQVDNVAAGNVSIQQTNNSTVVNQSSQKAIINWNSFNIGAQESTHFQQPAGGIVLNRISPNQGASSIYGSLTATGQVILVNPAGVYFGPSAYVNVGGLIATTGNITDQNFLNGKFIFTNVPGYAGSIINEGQIIAANNGLIALLSSGVMNNGLIEANLGKVVLASGSAFTLTFEGQDLISFTVDQATLSRGVDQNGNELTDGVKNNGVIRANGGQILVSAKAAAGVLDNVVNMGGMLQVQSVGQFDGDIVLSADTSIINDNVIRLSGLIDASGKLVDQIGGRVSVTGARVIVDSTAKIDASGYAGGGKIFIGGNAHGVGPLANANKTKVASGAVFNADAIVKGNGGQVVIWSNQATNFYGAISAKGGLASGNGGWVETSSKQYLDVNGATVNLLAAAGKVGTWLLDPSNIFIAIDQTSATAAGMVGADTSADTGSGGDPNTFAASGVVQDSLLTVANLEAALGTANVIVSTDNINGTGLGDITVVDPVTWSSGNYLHLLAANNIALNAGITMNSASASLILEANGGLTQAPTAVIAGAGSVTLMSSGFTNPTFTLSANNTYTGETNIGIEDPNGLAAVRLSISNPDVFDFTSAINIHLGSSIVFSGLPGGDQVLGTSAPINMYGGQFGYSVIDFENDSNSTLTLNNPISLNHYLGGEDGAPQISTNWLGFVGDSAASLTLNGDITFNDSSLRTFNGIASDEIAVNGLLQDGTNPGAGAIAAGLSSGGILSINNDNSATYSGNVLIFSGTVAASSSGSFGTGDVTVFNGGSLQLNGTNLAIANNINLEDGSTILSNNAFGTNSFDGAITLANNSTGIFVDLFGTFEILTFNGPISGTSVNLDFNFGALNSNNIVLAAANTFTGNVSVSGESGTLALANSNALGADNSTTTTLGAGTILALAGNGLNIANDLVIDTNTNVTPTTILESNSSSANTISGNIDFGTGNYVFLGITGSGTGDQLTLSGILSGSNTNLTIGSPGDANTLVLSGASASTYTGNTNIAGNVVVAQKNNVFGTSAVAVQSGAEVDINATNITLGNSFVLNGNGVSGYQGRPDPYGALVDLSSGSTNVVNGNVTLGAASSIGVNDSGNTLTINGVIDDGGNGFGITKIGVGNLLLANANTYSGGTNVDVGSVTVTNSGALGSGVAAVASGAELDINGNGLNILNNINIAGTGISGAGALVDISTAGNSNTVTGAVAMIANSTVGVTNSGAALTLEGVLSGVGFNFTKIGSGSLSLSSTNTNTYTGSTTVSAGVLQLLGDNDFGVIGTQTSGVSVATGATLNLASVDIAPNVALSLTGTLSASGTSSYAGGVTLNSGNSISNTGTLILSGQLTGSGALNKNGAGALALSNSANNYSGVTNINVGSLQLNASNVLPSTDVTVAAGATLNVNNFTETIGALSGAGNVTLGTLTGGTLITSGSTTGTFSGSISGGVIGNGGFTKGGSGSLNLTGTNTYVSATNVTGGILQLSSATALGDGVNNTSGVTVQSGGELFLNNVVLTPAAIPLSLSGSGVSSAGALAGTGTATWNGAITLAGNTSIGSVNTNDVLTLNGSVNGGFALTLNGDLAQSGRIVFNAPIGTISALASLTANSLVTLAGGTVTTSGAQNYVNSVTLAADTTLNTTDSLVTFSTAGISTINSDSNLTPRALTINAGTGNILMTSSVGATNALGALSLNSNGTATLNSTVTAASVATAGASGTTVINGGSITTTGSQTYGSAIQLGAATSLNSAAGNGAITFNNTVNGANTLSIDSGSGAVAFNASFGANSALSSLTTLGTGTVSFAANITTSGIQTYNSAALVTGASILTTSNSAVTFTSTIDGPQALTIAAGNGAVNLGGTVGAGVALASFSSTGGGTLTFNGGVTTTGAQNYASSVLLTSDSLFATTDAGVTFNAINSSGGARDLTINAGTGAITLNGPTGGSSALADINLNSTGTTTIAGNIQADTLTTSAAGSSVISASNITTSGSQTYNDAVSFTGATTTLDSSASNANLNFNSTIDGAAAVILNAGAGTVNLGGAVGANVALASLSSTGSGAVSFDGATPPVTVQTTGNQFYNGAAQINEDMNFISSTGNITFNSTLDGIKNFSTGSGSGSLIFNGLVGSIANLASLTANMLVTMNSNTVTTLGNQTYNQAITLNAPTTNFNTNSATGATVTFKNGINANNITVTGNGAGNNTLAVDVGATQNWAITGANAGVLSGIGTVTGAFNFANMNNLTGGSGNDAYTINGGTLSGNIVDSGGTNTLTADGGVLNNVWQISGTNAGSVTGINGFSGIQNLIGGDGGVQNNNTFIFADGSLITGTIIGSSLANPLNENTFDFSNYSLVNINIVSSIFNATALNGSNATIATYENINFVIGNPLLGNTINLPNQSDLPTTVVILDEATRHGTIDDPLTFTYFNVAYPTPPTPPSPPGPTPTTPVAQIIQQPIANSSGNTASTPISLDELFVSQNITNIYDQFSLLNETELKEVKINPYCYQETTQY
jgi:filamentous hemagglutinin family protein